MNANSSESKLSRVVSLAEVAADFQDQENRTITDANLYGVMTGNQVAWDLTTYAANNGLRLAVATRQKLVVPEVAQELDLDAYRADGRSVGYIDKFRPRIVTQAPRKAEHAATIFDIEQSLVRIGALLLTAEDQQENLLLTDSQQAVLERILLPKQVIREELDMTNITINNRLKSIRQTNKIEDMPRLLARALEDNIFATHNFPKKSLREALTAEQQQHVAKFAFVRNADNSDAWKAIHKRLGSQTAYEVYVMALGECVIDLE